jgi:hypothetical protein
MHSRHRQPPDESNMIASRKRPARIWRAMRTLNHRIASVHSQRRRLGRWCCC